MNSETKFHVSVMDARLKKVKKQCDQYKKHISTVLNTKVNESPLSSKLTIKDRQEIFYKYTNGHSMKKLAKEYNVHKDTIAYSVRKYKFEDDKHVG